MTNTPTTQQPPDKLQRIYEFLKARKVKVHSDYNAFQTAMQDDAKLQKVYDYLKTQPKVSVQPSYDEFKTSLLGGKKKEESVSFLGSDRHQDPLTQSIAQPESPTVSQEATADVASGQDLYPGLKPLEQPESIPPYPVTNLKTQQEAAARDFITETQRGINKETTPLEKTSSAAGTFNKQVLTAVTSIPKTLGIIGNQAEKLFNRALGMPDPSLETNVYYKTGQWLEDKALEIGIGATNPNVQDSFFFADLPAAFGSAFAIMASQGRSGFGGKTAQLLQQTSKTGPLAESAKQLGKSLASRPAMVGGTMSAVSEFEQAIAAGSSEEEAFGVFLKNYAIGQTEAIPFRRAFARINKLSGGKVIDLMKAGAVGGLEEATQEAVQRYLINKVAQGTYDPDRDSFKDMIRYMGAGAFVGFILPGIGGAMKSMSPAQRKATQQVLNDEFKNVPRETQQSESQEKQQNFGVERPSEPDQQPVAEPVTPVESIAPPKEIQGTLQENVGKRVNYQGIEGEVTTGNDGILYVLDDDGDLHVIEGGESGQTPTELGIYEGSPLPQAPVETETEVKPAKTSDVSFSPETNTVSMYGKQFMYDGVETDDEGITTAIRVKDAEGKTKFIRNQDAVLEIEIQKELYENTNATDWTAAAIQQAANEQSVKPKAKTKKGRAGRAPEVQQTGPVENTTSPAQNLSASVEAPLNVQADEDQTQGREGDQETLLTLESTAAEGSAPTAVPAVESPPLVDPEVIQEPVEESTASPAYQEVGESAAPPSEAAGTTGSQLAAGTEVDFEWLGDTKRGKILNYDPSSGKARIKTRDGTIHRIQPSAISQVDQDVKKSTPKVEEKVVTYNSQRQKPIGIVGDPNSGFMFQTDMGKKIKDFFKKQFTSKGYLPQNVFDRWIQAGGQIGKYEAQIKFTLSDVKKAIKSEYSGKPTDAQITDMNLFLQGKYPQNPIPTKTQALLSDMRAQIDNLSQRFIDEGVISGDLSATFTKNIGTYLTRSYRKFDDPFWAEFVPVEVKNKAEAFIRNNAAVSGENISDDEAEGLINFLLYDPKAPMAVLKGSKLGSKDLSILKKRGDIAPEIRALMGEYGDPLLNYARSVTKMANLIAKHHFLQDVRAEGMGTFLFEKPTGKYSVPVAAEGSKTMAPLNGLYTTPEIAEAFNEFNSMEAMPEWLKGYMKLISYVKANKTVFSVMTHARNIIGNLGFVTMNAHWRAGKIGKAAQTAWANVYSSDQAIRDKFKEYIELGVVQDSAAGGELRQYIKDIRDNKDFFEQINDSKLRKVKKGLLNTTQNLYQAEDDLFKIYAFENEYARYKKAYPNMPEAELKEKAAKIVRDTYPTYSMVPTIVKSLRGNPLLGTFVSFPAEVLRTTYNTIALAKEEMSNPSTQSIGAQRMAGIMLALGLPTAASYGTRAFLGLDGDDDDDIRKFVAPWQKNSEFLYLDVDGSKYKVIDMGYSDPHAYLKRPLYALLKGEDLTDAAIESAKEVAQPFLGENLLTERLIDISRNEKKTGDHVYNPDAPVGDRAKDIYMHIWPAFEPGTVGSLRRVIKAGMNETDKYGNKYELDNELVGLVTGQKEETKDITQALLFRAYEIKDRLDKTEKDYFRVAKNKAASESEKAAAKREHDVAIDKIKNDALDYYYSAIRLGVDPGDARKTMYRTRNPMVVKAVRGGE